MKKTTTEPVVRSVSDIHLAYIPFSHSTASGLVFAVAGYVIARPLTNSPVLTMPVGTAVVSHLILDLITHAPDMPLAPESISRAWSGIVRRHSIFCHCDRERLRRLLLVDVSRKQTSARRNPPVQRGESVSAFKRGSRPEALLAGCPMLIVAVIAVQMAVTLTLVGLLRPRTAERTSVSLRAGNEESL